MTEPTQTQSSRTQRVGEKVENNPLAVLAGGIALGVVIGALVPRLAKEKELLAPVGRKIADGASAAAAAARQAGQAELDNLLPGRDAAKEQIGKVIGSAFTAAKDATRARTDA